MIRLVCIVEIPDARTLEQAQRVLDAFRESVRPNEYGLSLYRASEAEADAAHYDQAVLLVDPPPAVHDRAAIRLATAHADRRCARCGAPVWLTSDWTLYLQPDGRELCAECLTS